LINGNNGTSAVGGEGLPKVPEKYTLKGHTKRINKVLIHPIYDLVATASEDGSIRLWNYDSGEHEKTLKSHTGMVNNLSFHPNGQFLASCSTDMTIKLWSLKTHTVIKTLQGHEHEVSDVEFV
jgi:platelet-activating factor acetylhydrolase IB subunit alpha